ncbi:methyltransferase [Herbidospora sp. NBRC 101105]|uniref:methyltransferase n=1 Tax=Herbidospora sp. NBRC 101105 TaxID=3032195 RepID=UPI002553A4D9|nr:methyltransferase [Herbidospora sp. NBRC 101105]
MKNLSAMAFGFAGSQILYAATKLGLPDVLARGPIDPGTLAGQVGADPGTLRRLLRALVVLDVAVEIPPDRYALSAFGQPLRTGHPRSIRSSVLLLGDPATWRAWGALTESVRTGETAWDHVHGKPLFEHLAGSPDLSAVFNTAMREGTGQVADLITFDFAGRTVVDVGGGNGTLLASILARTPEARGVLFDSAEGAADAPRVLAEVADRCRIEHGDFFDAVPEGDVIVLKGILHDWDDDTCVRLLRGCRKALRPGGRLLVVEPVMPERLTAEETPGVVMSDVAMLVYTGGRERTRAEFAAVLAAAGFTLTRVGECLGGSSIRVVEAAGD